MKCAKIIPQNSGNRFNFNSIFRVILSPNFNKSFKGIASTIKIFITDSFAKGARLIFIITNVYKVTLILYSVKIQDRSSK